MEDRLEKYRLVFMQSPIGLQVLGDILTLCDFGCTLDPTNQGQIGKYNVGTVILNRCGVFADGTLSQVLNALTAVSPVIEMPEQEEEK